VTMERVVSGEKRKESEMVTVMMSLRGGEKQK